MSKEILAGMIDLIQEVVEARLYTLNVCLPGVVQEYDGSTKTVSVQPAIKKLLESGEYLSLPLLSKVPVAFPKTANMLISWPLAQGDEGMIFFSQRSLEKWKEQGGQVEPGDTRLFNLSDGLFFPINSREGGPDVIPDKFAVQFGDAFISINQSGQFKMSNGTEELVTILSDFLGEMGNIKTNTMIGPQPPINLAAFSALKVRLDTLKE